MNAAVLAFPCTQLKIVGKLYLILTLNEFQITFMVIVINHYKNFFVSQLHALYFLSTTDDYCIKSQFPSISTAQRKCFQQLTVPLFCLTDLDFTQIVTISDRQFTWSVWLAVTHWGRVTRFFRTTPASSLMRVDVYVSAEGATKTLSC